MPELHDCTPPVRPSIAALLHRPDEPEPPANDPAFYAYDWEDQPAFRNVFLLHFTKPEDRAALEHVGSMLYEMALEMSDKWPDWRENPTRAELRAVAVDLRHSAAFLASVGKEREFSSLESLEETLATMAGEWALMVARIARAIEMVLPPIRSEMPQ
ncbi:MAG TPA: hypothetical protein VLX28_16725 [Thermoanaerobaculia bacterium]|nr:hypothetical protein [Thermoanaerobaculia bacterium]